MALDSVVTEKRLSGKSIIITGGSQGIGRSVADLFVRLGASTTIFARTGSDVDRAVRELRTIGPDVIGFIGDITVWADVEELVGQSTRRFGGIDVLVNAAAIQGPIGPLAEVEQEEWIRCIKVDLVGTMLCCRAVLPVMLGRGRGKIINFSGGGATSARPNFSAYACAKTAVLRLTETLAAETIGRGVDVNAIAPGVVKTRMLDEIAGAGSKAGDRELAQVEKISAEGGGSPKAAAELAVFLASDASDGITGRLISAVWDDWRSPCFREAILTDRSLGCLRRIDGRNFVGVIG